MAIEWSESMSTGIPEIDEEHKEWIRRFIKFDNAVINNLGMDTIQEALTFFEQYTETHFPHEEERAKNITAPIAEKNRDQHQGFRRRIAEIKTWIQGYAPYIIVDKPKELNKDIVEVFKESLSLCHY